MATSDENLSDLASMVAAKLISTGAVATKKGKKKRVNWETRFAYEYVNEVYPTCQRWFKTEVGALPKELRGKPVGRIRRWADAIVLCDGEVHILEFKMRPKLEAITQLELYSRLFPDTPEFTSVATWAIRPKLITTFEDTAVRALAEEKGIEYVIYKPSIYEDWYATYILKLNGSLY